MNQMFQAYEQPTSIAVACMPSFEPRCDEEFASESVSPALLLLTLGAASLNLFLTVYLLLWLI